MPTPHQAGVPTATATILFLTLLTTPALAHGPAPSPLRVLEITNAGRPDIVTTSMGPTFYAASDTYTYGCPSQWGDSDLVTPLTASLNAQEILIVGADALYTSTQRACPLTRLTASDAPETNRVADLHAVNGRVWGIANTTEDGRSTNQTWAWHPELGFETAFTLEDRKIDTLASLGDQLLLAGARPSPSLMRLDTGPLTDVALGEAESFLESWELDLPDDVQRLSLRLTDDGGERIWMVITREETFALLRSDDGGQSWKNLGSATRAIHGPVMICGGAVAVMDDVIFADPDVSPTCALDPLRSRAFACLRQVDGVPYFCELRQLKRIIEPEGDVGALDIETWYILEQISGPDLSCVNGGEDDVLACTQDWLHEAGEAGLNVDFTGGSREDAGAMPDAGGDLDASPDASQDTGAGSDARCGCAALPHAQPRVGALVLLLFACVASARRRSR